MLLLALMLACDPAPTDDADADPSVVDEDPPEDTEPAPVDSDGDGYFSVESGGDDCDDANPAAFPGAPEVWYDGVDQQCDGVVDDGDQDGDGQDWSDVGGLDCDDADPLAVFPELVEAYPPDGSVGVVDPTDLWVTVPKAHVAAVTLTVLGPDGPLSGAEAVEGASLHFAPADPLEPVTSYTLQLTGACGTVSASFTTADDGAIDPASLVGHGWRFDLDAGSMVLPAALGPILLPYLTDDLLLSALASGASTVDLRAGRAADGVPTQDLCGETADSVGDLSATPLLVVSYPYLDTNADFVLRDAVVTATLVSAAAPMTDAVLEGDIDTRDLGALGVGTPAEVCDLFVAFGERCVACSDGAPFCVPVRIEDLPNGPSPAAVVERTAADIAADPRCP